MSETHRSFAADFRHFFLRGLAALLPTLITFWLLVEIWYFLWEYLGVHLIVALKAIWYILTQWGILPHHSAAFIDNYFQNQMPGWEVELIGVVLAILLVYFIGLLVGNLIGRTLWGLVEMTLLRIPVIRAVYPAVKQITDYVLSNRQGQVQASQVVAVRPHENGIWSIGLVTGSGVSGLTSPQGEPMLTVFIPSSPTAFSGYVLVVPKSQVVELPMRVEDAMKMLVSGGVLSESEKARSAVD
ncbi:MAG TPA: DUF502 domain-containing protein [Tepidisphaeraceae bacterium]|nr:DUF502 domain-containing protein [Tepidisphaeraceae bacterium]